MNWRRVYAWVGMAGLLAGAHLQAQQPGAAIFAANCAGCHGADGRGGEHAPNIAGAPAVQQLTDGELAGIVHNGVAGAGMPAFPSLQPQDVTGVVRYLRTLQGRGGVVKLPGDAKAGQALFFGKARCAECHMVNGQGGFIGSELSYYGASAKPDVIRQVIVDPDKVLSADQKGTTVVTRKGETFTGMLRINDNFAVSIQTLDGAFHYIPKQDLAKADFGSRSLMPAASGLSSKEVDDLVSYLLQAGSENAKHAPHSAKSDDDN